MPLPLRSKSSRHIFVEASSWVTPSVPLDNRMMSCTDPSEANKMYKAVSWDFAAFACLCRLVTRPGARSGQTVDERPRALCHTYHRSCCCLKPWNQQKHHLHSIVYIYGLAKSASQSSPLTSFRIWSLPQMKKLRRGHSSALHALHALCGRCHNAVLALPWLICQVHTCEIRVLSIPCPAGIEHPLLLFFTGHKGARVQKDGQASVSSSRDSGFRFLLPRHR